MRISDWSSDVCSSDLTGNGWTPVSRRTRTLVSTATTPFPVDVLLQCLHDLRIGHRLDPRFEHARTIAQRRRRDGRLGLEQNAVVGVAHLQFKAAFPPLGTAQGLRSAARHVGKECAAMGSCWWTRYH